MKKYDIALFDLDGTLSESGEGILDCVRMIFKEMNRPLPDETELKKFIGPPMYDSLIRCGFEHEQAQEGVVIYKRNFLESGIYKNKVYDGIKEVLEQLKNNGVHLGVATTKYEPFAHRIIKMLELEKYFDFVGGATSGTERRTKAKVISYTLSALGADDNTKCIMIGDTKYDAEGAALTGVDFIGCLYGYGTKEEMLAFYENAVFVAFPEEIINIIL